MSSLASIPAILHTRMDLSNERSATTTHRIEALQRILPSLASFLDRDAAASIQDLGGRYCESESQRCDFSQENVDHEAATREFCKEGPLPYLDLQIDLRFETQVEVWIDTLSGLTSSTVPRQSRYLFLFEPEEITLLRESVKQNVHHFCRIFTHDWNTIVALPASSAVLFPHGGTWILPSAMRVYASQNVGVGSCDLLDHEVVDVCNKHLGDIGKKATEKNSVKCVWGDAFESIKTVTDDTYDHIFVDLNDDQFCIDLAAKNMDSLVRILKPKGVITAQVGSQDKKPQQVENWLNVFNQNFGNAKLSRVYIPSFDCSWNFSSSINH